jgi:hypothetical protein
MCVLEPPSEAGEAEREANTKCRKLATAAFKRGASTLDINAERKYTYT